METTPEPYLLHGGRIFYKNRILTLEQEPYCYTETKRENAPPIHRYRASAHDCHDREYMIFWESRDNHFYWDEIEKEWVANSDETDACDWNDFFVREL